MAVAVRHRPAGPDLIRVTVDGFTNATNDLGVIVRPIGPQVLTRIRVPFVP